MQKGFIHIIFLFIGVLAGIIILGLYAYDKGYISLSRTQTPSQLNNNVSLSITPTDTPVSVMQNWKVYKNDKYGFEFSYPKDYFFKINSNTKDPNELLQISNDPSFEFSETAIFIKVNLTENIPYDSLNSQNLNILNEKLDFKNLVKNYGNQLYGSFLGDPPFSYYYVLLPKDDKQSIEFSIRIHRTDEMALDEGGTEGKYIKVAKQILSSFKFTIK